MTTHEPSVGFDYAAIDRDEDDSRAVVAEGFSQIMDWCWRPDGDRRGAFARFLALSCLVKPGMIEGSYREIGEKYDISHVRLSTLARECQKEFGVLFRRSRK